MLDPSISGCSWFLERKNQFTAKSNLWPYEQHELALMFKCFFVPHLTCQVLWIWILSLVPWWGRFGSDEPHPAPRLQGPAIRGCRSLGMLTSDCSLMLVVTFRWNAYELYGSACNNQSFEGEEGLAIVSVLQAMYNVEVATFVRCPTKAYSNSATPWWSGCHKWTSQVSRVKWC